MPLFSVVIPTYNRESLVAATLDSVFAQELQDFEVIVVDDGSSDATLDIVRDYGDRVKIFEQDHKGCAAARNLGAREATGEYLAFLDSDDLWRPWALATARRVIEEADRPAIVAVALAPFFDESEVAQWSNEPLRYETGKDFLGDALRLGFAMGVAHTVCRREAYLACGGCVERNVNGTDSDVLLRMGVAPGFARIYAPPMLAYRQHGSSVIGNPVMAHAGAVMLLDHEATGEYPGGEARRRQRWEQVLRRVRAVSLRCLRQGRADLALDLYRRTLGMNVSLGRARYLLLFPLLYAVPPLRQLTRRV
ncbi:putative glycosyltransferase EpsJ [Pseudobythopirellula maris]|uniref:Putative glycosyltransferase EpsJ n=1 Tax=Pseudobythopirellula maris TaxID=2527991 RepID=A0A5C5ZP41_9BACT|nr:glycosyltransferase family 2 protein [Pseudobythopirellula maris]TWT88687.1 putative glycosyltransferase EpsJ [Pseudobythopirellula maris]